jgi:hypothetical protein
MGSGGAASTSSGGSASTSSGGSTSTSSGGSTAKGSGGSTSTGSGGSTSTSSGGQTTSGTGGVVGTGGAGGGTNHVSRDSNGWTVVTTSSDSRVIYVSSSQGKDTNDGMSDATALKTLAAGTAKLRPGYPDHLLLKSGDVWHETLGSYKAIGGRSSGEPMLISSYGTGARPSVRPVSATSNSALFGHVGSTVGAHMYFIGIEFYDSFVDPSSSEYNSSAAPVDAISWIDGGDDVLIEDCYFHFLSDGIVVQYNTGPSPRNVTIRRNEIVDNWASGGHAQGMFWGGVVGTNLIEENILDHNAWKDAKFTVADVFNHQMYITDTTNVTVKNNLFLRCSSLSLKFVYYGNDPDVTTMTGVVAYNNFFYQGEVGISMGADTGQALGQACYPTGCIRGPQITSNVLSQINQNTPTGRTIGWGMELSDVNGGTASGNLLADFSYTTNAYGIAMDDALSNAGSGNNTISQNLFWKIYGPAISMTPVAGWILSHVQNNTIVDPSLGVPLVDQEGAFTATAYSGNTYSPVSSSKMGAVKGATVSYTTWVTDSGETGSSVSTPSYPDPNRNLGTYVSTLSPSMTIAQYLTALRGVSKANWHSEYLAPAINDYIRAGFAMPAVSP